jgi:hypothetical protein
VAIARARRARPHGDVGAGLFCVRGWPGASLPGNERGTCIRVLVLALLPLGSILATPRATLPFTWDFPGSSSADAVPRGRVGRGPTSGNSSNRPSVRWRPAGLPALAATMVTGEPGYRKARKANGQRGSNAHSYE